MFERYTERARRVIFYARYEASQYGSSSIETEHLLLGLLREDFAVVDLLIPGAIVAEQIRKQIEKAITVRERISTSIEVPLTQASKRVLTRAAEEAEKCGHHHIGTEHLLLGLLRVRDGLAYQILSEHKPDLAKGEERVRKLPPRAVEQSRIIASGLGPFAAEIKFGGPDEFLNHLRAGNWLELRELFAEQSLFVDADGQIWSGRKDISTHLERLLAPFATKKSRPHLEAELSRNPLFWAGTVLWEHVLLKATIPGIVRMTLAFVNERGKWVIALLQISAASIPEELAKTAAS